MLKRLTALPLTHLGALVGAGLAFGMLAIMGTLLAWVVHELTQANSERYGGSIATQLSGVAASAVVTQDLLKLKLVTAQLADDPAILNAAIYDNQQKLLSTAGRMSPDEARAANEPTFEHPVVFESKPVGNVRVIVDHSALRPTPTPTTWLSGGALLVLALGIVGGRRSGQWLDSRLNALAQRLSRDISQDISRGITGQSLIRLERIANLLQPDPPTLSEPVTVDDARTTDGAPYLMVLNVFNQVSLPASDRERALEELAQRLARVCGLYRGRYLRLPGTGLMALFDIAPDDDHGFRAVCAALLTLKMANKLNQHRAETGQRALSVRAGLLRLERRPDLGASDDTLREELDSELTDAVLLSATARNDCVAVTRTVFQSLPDASYVQWNAIRAALPPSGDEGAFHYQIGDLSTQHAPLLDRQLETLARRNGDHP